MQPDSGKRRPAVLFAAMLALAGVPALAQGTPSDPNPPAQSGSSTPDQKAPPAEHKTRPAASPADRQPSDWMMKFVIIMTAGAAGRSAGSSFPK